MTLLLLVSLAGKRLLTQLIENLEALKRLNVLKKMCNNIEAIYRDLTFQVRSGDEQSGEQRQNSGIRQGCPLPPYFSGSNVCVSIILTKVIKQ